MTFWFHPWQGAQRRALSSAIPRSRFAYSTPTYLLVFGEAKIEEDGGGDLLIRICELMAKQAMPDTERSTLIDLAKEEHRGIVRITPYSTFESSPRHVYQPNDVASLTHDYGASLLWNAD